jgi:hypothetical protein
LIAEFIDTKDPRWRQFLVNTQHDFYHLPDYIEFAARYEGGTPVAFLAKEQDAALLAPLLIRELPASLGAPNDWCDAATPYGYPTPLLVPEGNATALERFLAAFHQVGRERGIITAFFRLHPLLPLPEKALLDNGTLVEHGQTISIDLSLPLQEMWTQTSRNHRQNIRKLLRTGFQVELDRWEYLEDFIAIYRQTMERCEAEDFFYFSDSYFTDLRTVLGEDLHIWAVISPQKEVAAGGLFSAVGGIVQAHLAGTADKYLHYAPAKLMFDSARRWAKETGNTVMHLGGGVGCDDDSLFRFKAGFSKWTTDFYTFRMVLDQEKYTTLNGSWQKRCAGHEEDPDFFPKYRINCNQLPHHQGPVG